MESLANRTLAANMTSFQVPHVERATEKQGTMDTCFYYDSWVRHLTFCLSLLDLCCSEVHLRRTNHATDKNDATNDGCSLLQLPHTSYLGTGLERHQQACCRSSSRVYWRRSECLIVHIRICTKKRWRCVYLQSSALTDGAAARSWTVLNVFCWATSCSLAGAPPPYDGGFRRSNPSRPITALLSHTNHCHKMERDWQPRGWRHVYSRLGNLSFILSSVAQLTRPSVYYSRSQHCRQ